MEGMVGADGVEMSEGKLQKEKTEGRFVEACERRAMKVNVDKCKFMVLGWEE